MGDAEAYLGRPAAAQPAAAQPAAAQSAAAQSAGARASSVREVGARPDGRAGRSAGPALDRAISDRAFFDRAILAAGTLDAARALIGAYLVRDDATGRRAARIEEVEAYIGEEDRASHARFGRTERNAVMWGTPGLAYVYLVYGMYDCLNVVTEPDGRAAAVLVRAALPTDGIEAMRASRLERALRRRRLDAAAAAAEAERLESLPVARLGSGPGLLAAAFGLDRAWTGTDLCDPASPLRLEPRRPGEPVPAVVATPRIGIGYAGEPWVSRPWRLVATGSFAPGGASPRGGRQRR